MISVPVRQSCAFAIVDNAIYQRVQSHLRSVVKAERLGYESG